MANGIEVQDDMDITCEEMASHPKEAFRHVDLGSGHMSPTHVDYHCPNSIISLGFMQELIRLAGQIRSPERSFCAGSIVYAHDRYFKFDLANLGYYPKGFSNYVRETGNYDSIYDYFKDWADDSIYNFQLYTAYINELNQVIPTLAHWYREQHNVSLSDSQQYSNTTIYRISNYAFGSYSSNHDPEPTVIGTDKLLQGDGSLFWSEYPNATDQQKYNALKRLLLANASKDTIKKAISTINLQHYPNFGEPLTSFTLSNKDNLELLLAEGYPVEKSNEFNKTALYYAIQYSLYDAVSLLIEYGANVNATYILKKTNPYCPLIDKVGRTPLMHAAQHADVAMIEILLNNGADLKAVDKEGENALDYAKRAERKNNALYLLPLLGLKYE